MLPVLSATLFLPFCLYSYASWTDCHWLPLWWWYWAHPVRFPASSVMSIFSAFLRLSSLESNITQEYLHFLPKKYNRLTISDHKVTHQLSGQHHTLRLFCKLSWWCVSRHVTGAIYALWSSWVLLVIEFTKEFHEFTPINSKMSWPWFSLRAEEQV